MRHLTLSKLKRGDKVAVLSPSFGAPAQWPHIYELGLDRLQNLFGLEPVEFSTTKKLGASGTERAHDLIAAFEDSRIKAVISTLGGDDQVTYVKHLPSEPFRSNPKPFFGYSDNTHFMNFLWLQGIPSYYGGALFTQFAEHGQINRFTQKYLNFALFEQGEVEIDASDQYSDIGLNWDDTSILTQQRTYELNDGWFWDGDGHAQGITWGGCLESIDEILRHNISTPSLEDFENIVLITETSEEIPSSDYVFRVYRALGERGILERVKGILVGRPKAWEFDKQRTNEEKQEYRRQQRQTILEVVRNYNPSSPVVQNLDFGHTEPQIPMPYGQIARVDSFNKKIFINF